MKEPVPSFVVSSKVRSQKAFDAPAQTPFIFAFSDVIPYTSVVACPKAALNAQTQYASHRHIRDRAELEKAKAVARVFHVSNTYRAIPSVLKRPSLRLVEFAQLPMSMPRKRIQSLRIDTFVDDDALMQSSLGLAACWKHMERTISRVVPASVPCDGVAGCAIPVPDSSVVTRGKEAIEGHPISGKVSSLYASSQRRAFHRSEVVSHVRHAFDSTVIANLLSALSSHDVATRCAIRNSLKSDESMSTHRLRPSINTTFMNARRFRNVLTSHLQYLPDVRKHRRIVTTNLVKFIHTLMPNASDVYDDSSLMSARTNEPMRRHVDSHQQLAITISRSCAPRVNRLADTTSLVAKHAVYHRIREVSNAGATLGFSMDQRRVNILRAFVAGHISDDNSLTTMFLANQNVDQRIVACLRTKPMAVSAQPSSRSARQARLAQSSCHVSEPQRVRALRSHATQLSFSTQKVLFRSIRRQGATRRGSIAQVSQQPLFSCSCGLSLVAGCRQHFRSEVGRRKSL